MKCPNCGEDVTGDVPFCPHCGQNISKRSRRKLRFILIDVQEDRRFRHLASAAVIVVVIVAVLAVLLALGGSQDDTSSGTDVGPSVDDIVISDTEFIDLGGDFDNGDLTATLDTNGQMYIALSDDISSRYDSYTWILRNENLNQSQSITKTGAELTWVSPSIGLYTVTVRCESEGDVVSAVYVGTIEYCGNMHSLHTFTYGGSTYSVYVDVTYQEYRDGLAFGDESSRSSPSAASGSGFINTAGCVGLLSQRLLDAYTAANPGASTNGAAYAEYVLSFVQQCFTVGSDIYYHSTGTYWATPAETLFTAVGDSGDLSVLAASLLRASGFDAGIAVIQGHGFAAISLNGYSGPSQMPSGYHTVRITDSGRQYVLCDVSDGSLPMGCVPEYFGYSDGHTTYFGQASAEGDGLSVPAQ